MAVLVADSIGKRFADRSVLSSASLRVVEGEIRVLVGRNGAGKSTLLRIAAGVIAPDHGLVIWRGERAMRTHLWCLARSGLMLLPADGVLAPAKPLGEQLALIAATYGTGTVADALERMRLEGSAHLRVHQLSGGERRRASLAAALVRKPVCLLADEVFRDVAPLDAELIGETLRTLARAGCAVLATGHELPFLMSYADHVTWCVSGTTRELGSPAHATSNDAFRAAYLGEPWPTTRAVQRPPQQ